MSMRKVLFISPYFPPLGGSGVFRVQRLVKYLPEFGIQPVVVHYQGVPGEVEDPGLVEELKPGLISYPVKFIEPSAKGIRQWLGKKPLGPVRPAEAGQSRSGLLKGLAASVRDRVLVPNLSVTWLLTVIPALKPIIDRHKPEAVFTTSSPEVSNLIGWYLKRKCQLPWIADFRDPWTDSVKVPKLVFPFSALERYMERKTLGLAEFVTAYSSGLAGMLRKKAPAADPEKFITLGPAVDAAKFDAIEKSAAKYDFLYTGYIDRLYPREFFAAVEELNLHALKRGSQESKPLLKVGLAGKVAPLTKEFFQKFREQGWLQILGYMPHNQTIGLVKSAKVLVLIHPRLDWWVPGKIAEYLYSGKPILAVVSEGELKATMKKFDRVMLLPDDRNLIAAQLEKALDLPEAPRSLPREFTAQGQAEIVARLIERAISMNKKA